MSPTQGPGKRRLISRARHACQRCRTQKLRCENVRPCSSCFRLGIECKESSAKATAHVRSPPADSTFVPSNPPPGDNVLRHTSTSAPHIAVSPDEDNGSPVVYSQRPSTYEAVDQVFRQSNQASLTYAADAIPGGLSASRLDQPRRPDLPLADILGLEVPPLQVVDFLLDTYIGSVHWFMSIIHEPSLRAEIHSMWASGLVPEHRKLIPILVLIILAFSARYTPAETDERRGFDLVRMESIWLKRVEEKLLDVLEDGGLEAVQIATLLKSYYLYGNRPKRSIAVLGAGIKVALSMKLHLEHTWTTTDTVRRQVMRRVWWTLYVADVWAATIYGQPCNIHDSDWDVDIPEKIDDSMTRYPGSSAHEIYLGNDFGPLTIFSYQRYKFWLYKIAFSIINNVYTQQRKTLNDTITQIKKLDERLAEWEQQIPAELRLSSVRVGNESPSETLRIFQRQAVVLQISYDNFRLLLHRPLLTLNRIQRPISDAITAQPLGETTIMDEMIKLSKYRCWDAAMRTSRIAQHSRTLGGMGYTLGASYIMIQSFTAAVALGIFALSDPASRQAYEAKGAISRILSFPKLYGYRSIIFDQCTVILEELIRLILNEEMRSLVSNQASEEPLPSAIDPTPLQPLETQGMNPLNSAVMSAAAPSTVTNGQLPSLGMAEDISWGNFSDALTSVHDAFREARNPADIAFASASSQQLSVPMLDFPLGAESQGWIWDEFWQVPDPYMHPQPDAG